MSRRRRELLKLERQKALSDFFYFAKHIWGLSRMRREVHSEFCDMLQSASMQSKDGVIKVLALMPRGSFKSSIIRALVIWLYLRDNNLRFGLASATLPLANDNLKDIKHRIQTKRFVELFGDIIERDDRGRPTKWNEDEIQLVVDDDSYRHRESTILVCAAGKMRIGYHCDVFILDDVVTEDTVTTPDQIRKTLVFYGQLKSIVDKGGHIFIIGTRYSYDDLYGRLLGENEHNEILVDYHLVERAERDDGTRFFPELYTDAYLEEQRKDQGDYMYSCQYNNRPTNKATAVFMKEDFRYIGSQPGELEVPEECTTFLLVDPAKSEKKSADYTALVTVKLDSRSRIFVPHAQQVKAAPSAVMDMIYGLDSVFHYDMVGIEQVGMQMFYDWMLDRINNGVGRFLPLKAVKTSTSTTKDMRIRTLEPYVKAGRLYLQHGLRDLEDQLTRYPSIVKDDLVDALSMITRVGFLPDSAEDQELKKKHRSRRDVANNPSPEKIRAELKKAKDWYLWP